MARQRPLRGGATLLTLLAAACHPAQAARPAVTRPATPRATQAPSASTLARLSPDACFAALRSARVAYERVSPARARRVAIPVRLRGGLSGVQLSSRSGRPIHEIVDCRLVLALLRWAPALRAAGVVKLEHYSAYRPGARVRRSGRPSGHARALALDAARFHLADGRVLDVDRHWTHTERGGPVCARRRESRDARLLRGVVCDAVSDGLFQVVLTPHYDRDHRDHVHLELVPEVDWTFVR